MLAALSPLPAIVEPSIPVENTSAVESAEFDSHGLGNLSQQQVSDCAASACSIPAQPINKLKSYSFQEVWSLILKHHKANRSHFTPELIACLMWEESGFRLIENPTSNSLGFGQVLPATLRELNKRYKKNFTRARLLTSADASVEATVLALEVAWDWKKEKVGALVAYAGGFRNYGAVRKWLTAEPRMLKARISRDVAFTGRDKQVSGEIADALHICSQPGFHPQALF